MVILCLLLPIAERQEALWLELWDSNWKVAGLCTEADKVKNLLLCLWARHFILIATGVTSFPVGFSGGVGICNKHICVQQGKYKHPPEMIMIEQSNTSAHALVYVVSYSFS